MHAVTTATPARFIGCDVGKHEIVVFDSLTLNTHLIANTPEAIDVFVENMDCHGLVICEATGGYEAVLLAALVKAGISVHRADARKVKAFIRSFGTLGKNDALDARALVRYGQERHQQLARWQPRDSQRERLNALVLLRQSMVESRTAWSNRNQAPKALAEFTDPICQAFDQQIKTIDAEISRVVESSDAIKRDVATLRTIKGIGPVTAPALLALMPELGTLTGKQSASLAGLAPHPDQSGSRDGYRRVRGGRPQVRRLLFMSAFTAIKHDPTFKLFYQRLLTEGKKPLVALTAVMRKMVVIANARLRDERQPQVS